MGLYAIVDMPHPHGLTPELVTKAVLGDRLRGGTNGASVIQLRAKGATTAERLAMLNAMAPLCRACDVPLIVNDDLEAARVGPISGIHLGQTDVPKGGIAAVRQQLRSRNDPPMVGLSTHDLSQLRAALRDGDNTLGPSYVALGPVAATRSKANPEPVVGMATLLDACRIADRPLVAIGGLDQSLGCTAHAYGTTHVAMIGALVAPTPAEIESRAIELAKAFASACRLLSLSEVVEQVPAYTASQLTELTHWCDDLGVLASMGLPARFRPIVDGSTIRFRPSDVIDLMQAANGGNPTPDATRLTLISRGRP